MTKPLPIKRMRTQIACILGGFVCSVFLCTSVFAQSVSHLPPVYAKLAPLHKTLPPPQPGEWLAEHKEPGQTLAEYRRTKYVKAVPKRKTIYIQVLGGMTKKQAEIGRHYPNDLHFADFLTCTAQVTHRN